MLVEPLYLACSHQTSFPGGEGGVGGRARRKGEARVALGLAPHGVYLGALNKYYKVTPGLMDAWAAILRGTPNSTLVFMDYRHYPEAKRHLR